MGHSKLHKDTEGAAKEIKALRTQHELSHTSDSFGANSEISACAPLLLVSLGSLKKIAKGKGLSNLSTSPSLPGSQLPGTCKPETLEISRTSGPFCLICNSLLRWPPALLMPSQFGWQRSTKSRGRTLSAHVPAEDENYAIMDGHVMSVQA